MSIRRQAVTAEARSQAKASTRKATMAAWRMRNPSAVLTERAAAGFSLSPSLRRSRPTVLCSTPTRRPIS